MITPSYYIYFTELSEKILQFLEEARSRESTTTTSPFPMSFPLSSFLPSYDNCRSGRCSIRCFLRCHNFISLELQYLFPNSELLVHYPSQYFSQKSAQLRQTLKFIFPRLAIIASRIVSSIIAILFRLNYNTCFQIASCLSIVLPNIFHRSRSFDSHCLRCRRKFIFLELPSSQAGQNK